MRKSSISINFRPLIYCGVALVVLAGSLHLAYSFQWQRNSAALLASADRAEQEGKKDRALRFLNQYVTRVPGDSEALARFGFLLDGQGASAAARRGARSAFEEVLIREPDRQDVRRRLALLTVKDGDWDAARPHLEILLKDNPKDAEIHYNLGLCLQGARQPAEAARHYEAACEQDPSRVESFARWAGLLNTALANPKKAEEVVNRMVKANEGQPNAYQAYLARARFYADETSADPAARAGALAKARRDIDEALKRAPDEPVVLFAAAEFAQKQGGDLDRARGYLRRVLEKYPRAAVAYQTLAALELRAGRPDEAAKCLRAGLKQVPEDRDLLWNMARLLIETGDRDEANRLVDKLAERDLAPGRLDLLRAAAQARDGNWLEASRTLESVRPFFAGQPQLTVQTDMLLAQCYDGLGDPERSLLALRRIATQEPLNGQARALIARTLLKAGRMEESLDEYQRLMDLPNAPATGWPTLARLLIAQNARLPARQQDWERVGRVLDRAAQATPDSAEVPILRARVLLARGKPDQARALLKEARDKQPGRLEFWQALAELEEQAGNPEGARGVLEDAGKRLGDSAALRLSWVSYYLGRDRGEALPGLARLGDGADAFAAEDRARLLAALGDAAYQMGDVAEARRRWGQVAELQPGNMDVRLLLFEVALQQDDEAAARKALESIRKAEGDSRPVGLLCEAGLLIWQGGKGDLSKLADARVVLTEVEARRPGWARVATARARIDELEKSPDRAVEDYLKAFELGERRLGPVRQLLQLLYDRKRYAEADLVLRKLPEQVVLSANLQHIAAEASLQTRDYARALELARKAVPPDSKDYHDHIWLGQLLWAAGKPQEAEPALRRATELAPKVPDVWVALVQFLARTDQVAAAEKVIDRARASIPADQAHLPLAQCYAAVNRLDQAREHFRAALHDRPDDPAVLQAATAFYLRTNQLTEAEACLRTLADQKAKEPALAAQAQRTLAIVLAAGKDYRRAREALALLGLSADGTGTPEKGRDSSEDQRARAVVLASQGDRGHIREAVRILEALDQRQPLAPEESFLLVQLYDRLGEKQKFQSRLERLVTANADNPRYLAYYVGILLRQKRLADAAVWLKSLEKVLPDRPPVVELRARLLQAEGNADQAAALVKARIPTDDAPAALGVARLLEQLGRPADADTYYQRYITLAKQPEAVLVRAEFLGRQNRHDEALELCAAAEKNCPAETVAYSILAVVRSGKPREDHYRRVQAALERWHRQAPDQVGLLLSLASFADLRGRYEEAEELYRKATQMSAQNIQALNNLAWLQAELGHRTDEAVRLASQAIQVAGPMPALLDTRGVAYLAAGQTELAVPDLEEAATRPDIDPPTHASMAFHLARAYLAAGRREAAIKALADAREAGLTPDSVHPLEREALEKLTRDLASDGKN